jgi:hypothetical protein
MRTAVIVLLLLFLSVGIVALEAIEQVTTSHKQITKLQTDLDRSKAKVNYLQCRIESTPGIITSAETCAAKAN